MLHVDSDSTSKVEPVTTTNPLQNSSETNNKSIQSLCASSSTQSRSQVLLATARVIVGVPSGRTIIVRALLDQGSEMTFITENLAQCLRAKRIRMPISITAVGCVNAGTYRHATRITISPRDQSTPAFSTTALILKSLTSYAPRRVINEDILEHLADLPWADHDPMSVDPIDVIIGADLYSELILGGVRKGTSGRPVAQNSVLGWVISGPTSSPLITSHTSAIESARDPTPVEVNSHHCFDSFILDKELRRFWEVEEIPRQHTMSPEDEKCEQHFRLTHSRCPDGRYMVRLSFKDGPPIVIG